MNNKKTVILILSTVLLAAVAIGTAFWLYQLQSQSVAPTAPESKPQAQAPVSCAPETFSLIAPPSGSGAGSLATGSATTVTPTKGVAGSTTKTPTPTASSSAGIGGVSKATPTPTKGIGGASLSGATATPTKKPTAAASSSGVASLPDAGVSWPILASTFAGILLLLFGLFLAL